MYIITVGSLDYRDTVAAVESGVPCRVHFSSINSIVQFFRDLQIKMINFRLRMLFPLPHLDNVYIKAHEFPIITPFTQIDQEYVNTQINQLIASLSNMSDSSAAEWLSFDGFRGDHTDFNRLLSRELTFEVRNNLDDVSGGCNKKKQYVRQLVLNPDTQLWVVQLVSMNQNCFFACLRYIFTHIKSTKFLRNMYIKHSNALTIKEAYSVISGEGFDVILVTGYNGILIDAITKESIDLQYVKKSMIILHNQHYFPIVHIDSKAVDKVCKCGSDCKQSDLRCPIELEHIKRSDELSRTRVDLIWDLETHPDLTDSTQFGGRTFYKHKPVLCVVSIPSTKEILKFIGLNCIALFIKFLTESETKYRCYAHNAGGFDNYFIFEYIMKHNLVDTCYFFKESVVLRGSRILSMEFHDHVFFDTMNHLVGGLAKLCSDFKLKTRKKTEFVINGEVVKSTDFFTKAVDVDVADYIDWLKAKRWYDAFIEYCVYDCLSLGDLWQSYKREVENAVLPTIKNRKKNYCKMKKIVNNSITLPSASKKFWHLSLDEEPFCPPYDSDLFKLCDKAIIGGISLVNQPGKHEMLACVDVVSLYVWAMINNEFPDGVPSNTDEYVEGKLGIYECSFVECADLSFCDIPVLRNGILDWKQRTSTDRCLSSIDIDRIRSNGGTVVISKGVYWRHNTNMFKNYLEPITKGKKLQDVYKEADDKRYNPALREVIKLLGNALFGKMMERKKKYTLHIVESLYDIEDADFSKCFIYKWRDRYLVKTLSTSENKSPIYLGVFVLAYSRNLMMHYYDLIGRENVIATETDSIYFPRHLMSKFQHVTGKDLGLLDIEYPRIPKSYFISRKAYALYLGGLKKCVCEPQCPTKTCHKTYKFRLKGIPRGCLTWDKYKEWFLNKEVEFNITFFKRDLFHTSSIYVGKLIKKQKLSYFSNSNITFLSKTFFCVLQFFKLCLLNFMTNCI